MKDVIPFKHVAIPLGPTVVFIYIRLEYKVYALYILEF